MTKIMTIVGTRPELIKMARVIATFDEHTDHILVHTGQNYDYELNKILFEQMGIRKPDYFLGVAGSTACQTIAAVIEKVDEILSKDTPEAVLIYGDTNSCLSVIAAKRRKIPIFHMEAGNRCFDQRVPEEINRKIVDHISDINLTLSEHARRYLLAEGLPKETVIKVGSHMEEILEYYKEEIAKSKILFALDLRDKKYFLVSAHREENVDSPESLNNLVNSLHALAEEYDLPVIVSMHPRTRTRLSDLNIKSEDARIRFLKPFGFLDYVKLQQHALCILSDSGTITEEAALLNLPAITIREAHERPEGMDEGTLIMCGLRKEKILQAVKIVISQHKKSANSIETIKDYRGGKVSQKVLRIVLSYIDYINRTVWWKINK